MRRSDIEERQKLGAEMSTVPTKDILALYKKIDQLEAGGKPLKEKWDNHNQFTIPPWMDVRHYPSNFSVEEGTWWSIDDYPRIRPNSYKDDGRGFHRKGFPNNIELDMPNRDNPRDVALDFMSLSAASYFHELLEWVTIDGELLAIPHPENDMEPPFPKGDKDDFAYWNWLTLGFRRTIVAYCRRYPKTKRVILEANHS